MKVSLKKDVVGISREFLEVQARKYQNCHCIWRRRGNRGTSNKRKS